jgi:hypothetical protein
MHRAPAQQLKTSANRQDDAKAPMWKRFGNLPLYLVENRGQLDKRAAFYAQGSNTTIYFTDHGLTFELNDRRQSREIEGPFHLQQAAIESDPPRAVPLSRYAIALDFVNARPGLRPTGRQQTSAVFSYFKGSRDKWKAGLRSYSRVVYENVWPGIDLVIDGTINRMKQTFIVKPGADTNQIRMSYRGATDLRVNEEGQLKIETPAGAFTDERPVAWQDENGHKVEVSSQYLLDPVTKAGEFRYGFGIGDYDRSRELVIDPEMLVYSGYIGGSGGDFGSSIAVDDVGNAYITGSTNTSDFPVTVGPDTSFNGSIDAFVAKVRADGTGLVYCGYIGGSDSDSGHDIAVDGAGNAYVIGFTRSFDLAVMVGPDTSFNEGVSDAFVAKVKSDGSGLEFCGYIGGSGSDSGNSIAVDGAGNTYVTGFTPSSDLPVIVGPDNSFNGVTDAFVAKVRADGTGLDYCGYIGGSGNDLGLGIAVDSTGNAYITGDTLSSDLPVVVGPDTSFNGVADAFVAKVRADGIGLGYCGYIGGSDSDSGHGIAVDGAGHAYITGNTHASDFPVTVGPDTSFNGGVSDAFVAKVRADGSALDYCGYIGGSDNEDGRGIAVDSGGNVYVIGFTESSDFPVTVGPDISFNGDTDAFVAKLRADGKGLGYCGYIGGSSRDLGLGIAVDGAGNAYITGDTDSPDFPVAVGPDTSFNGSVEIFVAKIISPTPSTREAIDKLINEVKALVAAGHLKREQGFFLITRLEAAMDRLDRGDINLAIYLLDPFFIYRLNSLIDSGELSMSRGQPLIKAAHNIIAELKRL